MKEAHKGKLHGGSTFSPDAMAARKARQKLKATRNTPEHEKAKRAMRHLSDRLEKRDRKARNESVVDAEIKNTMARIKKNAPKVREIMKNATEKRARLSRTKMSARNAINVAKLHRKSTQSEAHNKGKDIWANTPEGMQRDNAAAARVRKLKKSRSLEQLKNDPARIKAGKLHDLKKQSSNRGREYQKEDVLDERLTGAKKKAREGARRAINQRGFQMSLANRAHAKTAGRPGEPKRALRPAVGALKSDRRKASREVAHRKFDGRNVDDKLVQNKMMRGLASRHTGADKTRIVNTQKNALRRQTVRRMQRNEAVLDERLAGRKREARELARSRTVAPSNDRESSRTGNKIAVFKPFGARPSSRAIRPQPGASKSDRRAHNRRVQQQTRLESVLDEIHRDVSAKKAARERTRGRNILEPGTSNRTGARTAASSGHVGLSQATRPEKGASKAERRAHNRKAQTGNVISDRVLRNKIERGRNAAVLRNKQRTNEAVLNEIDPVTVASVATGISAAAAATSAGFAASPFIKKHLAKRREAKFLKQRGMQGKEANKRHLANKAKTKARREAKKAKPPVDRSASAKKGALTKSRNRAKATRVATIGRHSNPSNKNEAVLDEISAKTKISTARKMQKHADTADSPEGKKALQRRATKFRRRVAKKSGRAANDAMLSAISRDRVMRKDPDRQLHPQTENKGTMSADARAAFEKRRKELSTLTTGVRKALKGSDGLGRNFFQKPSGMAKRKPQSEAHQPDPSTFGPKEIKHLARQKKKQATQERNRRERVSQAQARRRDVRQQNKKEDKEMGLRPSARSSRR